MDRLELARKEAELLEAGTPYAAVTIVHSAGTARTEGKMLVLPDETIYGTVGGGAGEKLAIRDAVTLLAGGENAIRHYELDSPLSAAGQACGGSLAGFSTTLLDTRGEEMIAPAIKAADRFIQLENFGEALANTRLPAGAYYVVASYSHAADGEALGGVLHHTDAAYVGMIGSRRKVEAIRQKLTAEGITAEQLDAVHSPIGLSLGGETPEEIAVSILAELLMTRYGKTKADL